MLGVSWWGGAGRPPVRARRGRSRVGAVLLAAGMLAGSNMVTAFAAPSGPAKAGAPPLPAAKSVTGVRTVAPKRVAVADGTTKRFAATAVTWPRAASGTARLTVPTARTTAPGTPVWLQSAAPPAATYQGPSSVGVRVLSHQAAAALGVSGVVFTVANGAFGSGKVRVGLDYSAFAQVYGGNYGSRLRLVALPACALTTPGAAACQRQTPLPSSNDAKGRSVSAVVTLGRAATASVVVAATDATDQEGGSAGSYSATALSPSGTWSEGGDSGSFTYTYPVTVPAASSSLTPSVDLSYDSGAVDGQTSSTQAQSSWVGDGWSTADSYVEQSFTPCADSPEGSASPSGTNDECYDGNVLTMSLNGSSTQLVFVSSSTTSGVTTSKWRAAGDNGEVITHVAKASTAFGAYSTAADYWTVTERNGVQYVLGRDELPGWASGDAATNSVDTEPVYSAHSGDPCYSSSGFSSSVCTMPYKWHLDYVTDLHGDAMAYYYTQATNYYGENNGAKDVSYVRDSYLDHIDYGFRAGGAYGTVPDRVVFTASSRCTASTCGALSSSTAATEYPDVPFDLVCASGATCGSYSPSFFSTVRLSAITTEQYSTSAGKFVNVDTYALTESTPATGDGTSPTLWLASIGRTGDDTAGGGSASALALPNVTFGGTSMNNRVDTSNFPGLTRYRVTSITTEMGAVTGITYTLPTACTASYAASATASSNTESCFPVYWTPQDYTAPILDWFNKYAVSQVRVSDATGGGLTKTTGYAYSGGAAWHYDDNEVVKAKYRTYGQFRGYGSVETLTGDGSNDRQTESVTSYYRGMNGDWLSSSSTRSVTVTDSQGGVHTDADQLSGQPLETTTYLGSGGPVDDSTVHSYWVSAASATESRSGLPSLTSTMVDPAETWTRQAVTDGGTTSWRYTETDDSYDATTTDADFGLLLSSYTHAGTSTALDDTAYDSCVTTTYAPANTGLNLVGLVASTETDSVKCSGFTEGSVTSVPAAYNTLAAPSSVTRPAQVESAVRNFYDDTTFSTTFPQTTAPTVGDVTMTRKAADFSAGAFVWQTSSRDTHDAYGRVVDSYNGNGDETVTTYTVNSAGLTTGETVAQPTVAGVAHTIATTYDTERNLTLTGTDVNGVVTTKQYDALGRLTGVWLYSRPVSAPANTTYAYTVSNSSVSGVVTQSLDDAAAYTTSVTIDDALGRTRQTQSTSPRGGRLITDSFYNSRGEVWKKNTNYWDSSATPALTLVAVADNQVADQDVYTFDGMGRTVVDDSDEYAAVKQSTTTVYNGDRTTVIPPAGGTVKSTVTDPLGRTSEVDEYSAAPALVTPSDTFAGLWYVTGGSATALTYGYDGHGDQATTTDSAGDVWRATFNLLGEATTKSDPSSGTTSTTYDADGNVLQTEDARGDYVSYTYDALDRKTGEYASTTAGQTAGASGDQLAAWVYDNANGAVSGMGYPVGQTTTSTAYSGGQAYVTQALGFNVFAESLGESVTVPSVAAYGGLAKTWTFKNDYTTTTGLKYSETYPSGGGLPLETVLYSYATTLDLPSGAGSADYGYAASTTYDQYGNVEQVALGGASTDNAYVTDTYDPHTNLLTDQLVTRNVASPSTLDDTTYSYDPAGDITSQTENRLGSSSDSETQCYTYDALDRLTAAWTATDSCAAAPTSAGHAQVANTLGSGSAYWDTWTYDALGNRTGQTQHSLTTGTADTTTSYTYNGNSASQAGTLTSNATTGGAAATTSASYAYDAAGDMTTRDAAQGDQTLSYDSAGRLSSTTTTAGVSTGYVYDAGGNLLLQTDPSGTTLYLGDEQLTLNAGSGTVTGDRYYGLPGGETAVRTGTGTAYGFELGDRHATNTLYLDSTAQNPTWRQFDPFGNVRGTAVSWVDNRTFLDKTTDPVTGLTDVGARFYDPVTGRFITLDPVFEAQDPQAVNGYSYADQNPVGNSDPSGDMFVTDGGVACGSIASCTAAENREEAAQARAAAAAEAAAENSDIDRCSSGMCMMRVIHNYTDPRYAADATVRYAQRQAQAAAEAERERQAAAAAAANSCSGFWGCLKHDVSHAVTAVSNWTQQNIGIIATGLDIATLFFPGLAPFALLADGLSTISTGASVVEDFKNHASFDQKLLDMGSFGFSAVGFGAMGKATKLAHEGEGLAGDVKSAVSASRRAPFASVKARTGFNTAMTKQWANATRQNSANLLSTFAGAGSDFLGDTSSFCSSFNGC